MAKETKQVNLRVPVTMYEDLTNGGEEMFNPALVAFYERAKNEEKIRMLDIRGIFSKDEWMALAAGLNGTLIDDFSRYSPDMFIAHNEDAEKYEGCFSQFGVKVDEVNAKIARLTRIQIATIYKRITDFWENQRGAGEEFEKWADF